MKLLIYTLIFLAIIPVAIAPIWYGSGDDTGLVGRWSCEGNFLDSSGQGNNGTQSGGVTITSGVKGRACGFDGVDDNVRVDDNGFSYLTGTISAWVKPYAYPAATKIIFMGSVNPNRIYFSIDSTGNFTHTLGSVMTITPGNLPLNTWSHAVLEWNGTHAFSYLNGALINTSTYTNLSALGGCTNIGSYTDCSAKNSFFNGSVDELRVYNRTLSADEISTLYDTGKTMHVKLITTPTKGGMNDTPAPTLTDETGLVGYWKLDGDATDSSDKGNDGTATGATTNNGRWNEAYFFDGDDYIQTTDNALNFSNKSFTMSAWVRSNQTGTTRFFAGKANGVAVASSTGYVLYLGNTGAQWTFGIWNGTANKPIYDTTNAVKDKWYHVVGTYDHTTSIGTLYVDGTWKANSSGSAIGSIDVANQFMIGRVASNYWTGDVDEVRVYNKSLSAAEVKELYLSKGLVGYWKMDADQKNTTSTFDSSGYYNHGLISGATLTNEGRFKEGYKFDGSNDYINLGASNKTISSNNTPFTISAWAKPSSIAGIGIGLRVFSLQRSAGSSYISLGFGETNKVRMACNATYYDSTQNVLANQWYHIAVSYNGTNNITLYINGIIDRSLAGIITGSPSSDIATIGSLGTALGYYWNGSIDEVRVYNRALTASEIAGLYNGTKTNKISIKTTPTLGGLNDTPTPTITDETGLVGYWKMDNDFLDSSSNIRHASGIRVINNTGRWNEGYFFNGTSSCSSSCAINATITTPEYTFGTNVSVCAWTKPKLLQVKEFIMHSTVGNGAFEFYQNTAGLGLRGGATSPAVSSSSGLIIDKWTFLCATINQTTGTIYVDGALQTTGPVTVPDIISSPIYIGSYSNGAYTYNGVIDEVRIYNRTISSSEIQELYLSKGLVGHWKMDADQKNSTSTFDSSGYYNHGLISGATLTNEGKFKEGMKFDGNDVITVSNTQLLNYNFTISGWVYSSGSMTDYGGAFGAANWGTNVRGLAIRNSFGNLIMVAGNNSANVQDVIVATITTNNSRKWHHVAASYNGTTINSYANGILVDSSPFTLITSNTNFLVGKEGINAEYWNGTIDEVRVYNRALSSTEIGQLYNGTKTYHLRLKTVAG